jgi:hypothetical protein
LQEQVPKSTADWQFIVNHYPAQYSLGGGSSFMDWKKFLAPMGIDLYVSGHTHLQRVYYMGSEDPALDMGETAWVITGGGGGVTSEIIPVDDGNDDAYGFMDIEISLHNMTIKAYTHGGLGGKTIIRNTTVAKPVTRKSHQELVALGLMRPEQVTESTHIVV